LDWAEVVAQSGSHADRAAAAARVSEHVDVLDELRARPAADRARRVLRRLGSRPAPARRVRLPGPLSVREIEIARLVADGLTNPELADRLFISQRTGTTHLQHLPAARRHFEPGWRDTSRAPVPGAVKIRNSYDAARPS
jgi:DNA-binding CsgD family transcriptional regulator